MCFNVSVTFPSTFPLRFRQRFRHVSVNVPLRFRWAGVRPMKPIWKLSQRIQGPLSICMQYACSYVCNCPAHNIGTGARRRLVPHLRQNTESEMKTLLLLLLLLPPPLLLLLLLPLLLLLLLLLLLHLIIIRITICHRQAPPNRNSAGPFSEPFFSGLRLSRRGSENKYYYYYCYYHYHHYYHHYYYYYYYYYYHYYYYSYYYQYYYDKYDWYSNHNNNKDNNNNHNNDDDAITFACRRVPAVEKSRSIWSWSQDL